MSTSMPSTPAKAVTAAENKRKTMDSISSIGDEEQQHDLFPHHGNNHDSSSPASHFFTSVISAAQNAASSLTGMKGNEGELGNRQRSLSDPSFFQSHEPESSTQESSDKPADNQEHLGVNDVVIEPLRSAITTLGKGELSLASLGLDEAEKGQEEAADEEGKADGEPDGNSSRLLDDEESVVSDSKSLDSAKPDTNGIGQEFHQGGALAIPTMSRSKSRASSLISRQRRKRKSSSTTEGDEDEDDTGRTQRSNHITGFAYANKKRNKDFHRLFRSVTLDDYLLDDFSCALSREILIHGRLYVSEKHVCFNSNILGWVTNLIIGFDEIVTLEKKNTAGLFPNGLIIQTLHARHSFASFVSRDTTLEFLTSVWKQASPHQTRLEGGNSLVDLVEDSDESDDDEEGYDDDDLISNDDNDNDSLTVARKKSLDDVSYDDSGSLGSFGTSESLQTVSSESTQEDVGVQTEDKDESKTEIPGSTTSSNWPVANLGPDTHGSTDVGDPESKGEKILQDESLPAPLGVVVNLLFGEDTTFMERFIEQKNTNLTDFKAFGKEKTRKYEYIKPLSAPVGPKQTRCICTDTIEEWDFEKRIVVVTSTSTPDVPSGGAFVTKTRYSIGWAENNQAKLVLSFVTEWSGKSWFKGAIEKGSLDGQTQFSKDLFAELNSALKGGAKRKRPSTGGKAKKSKRKGKKSKRPEAAVSFVKSDTSKEGGVAGIVHRFGELMNTEISSTLPIPIWGIIITVLLFCLFNPLRSPRASTPQAKQDKLSLMMLQDEYEVWKWIDDRVEGRDSIGRTSEDVYDKKAIQQAYGKQEIAESIRITQQRLNLLKDKLNI